MRFLANENFPRAAVDALHADGHDVKWIRTEAPGVSDAVVLQQAIQQRRVVLTFDKDFGELAFRQRREQVPGIVLFRCRLRSAEHVADLVMRTLRVRSDWERHFSVVEEACVRMIPL